jgi:hypothetical protein
MPVPAVSPVDGTNPASSEALVLGVASAPRDEIRFDDNVTNDKTKPVESQPSKS